MIKLPERRRGMRFLTLKNTVWVLGSLLAAFIAFSAYNELRPREAARERLYERGSVPAAPVHPPAEVIGERPVSEVNYPTPRLVERPTLAESPVAPAPPPPQTRRPTLKETQQRGGRTVIRGDADGLRVDVIPTATAAPVPPDRF